MEQHLSLTVVGGDTRMLYAAKRLEGLGYHTKMLGSPLLTDESAKAFQTDAPDALGADVLVLGLPVTKNTVTVYAPFAKNDLRFDDIYKRIRPHQRILGGMVPQEIRARMEREGAEVSDYYTDEHLLLYNALLTAEALTGILIQKLPCSVAGNPFAVVGYGRIGYYTAKLLKGLGAHVTVFARNGVQRSKAALAGMQALPLSELKTKDRTFCALVNTVPAPVVGVSELTHIGTGCLLLEAAGAPYGIDKTAASALGFAYFPAAGLPGKYAPQSAGAAIADAVHRYLREVNTNGSA